MFVRLVSRMAQPIFKQRVMQFRPVLGALSNNRLILHNLIQIRIPIIDQVADQELDEELQDIGRLTSA